MSTAAAWDTLPIGHPVAPGRARGQRPTLVVIEGGAGRDSGDVGARPVWLRLPQWGRLAATLSVLAVVASLAVSLLFGGGAAASATLGSVEVRTGQTLSEIARAEMPGVPTAEAVARIQLANNLPSSSVTAGQVLVIPRY